MTGNELVKSHFRDHLSYGTEIRALLTYPNGKDKPSEKKVIRLLYGPL